MFVVCGGVCFEVLLGLWQWWIICDLFGFVFEVGVNVVM